eukprot:1980676-Rhodomonas_salina.1
MEREGVSDLSGEGVRGSSDQFVQGLGFECRALLVRVVLVPALHTCTEHRAESTEHRAQSTDLRSRITAHRSRTTTHPHQSSFICSEALETTSIMIWESGPACS